MSGRPTDLRVLARLNSLELGGTQINAVDFAAQLREHGVSSHLVGPRSSLRSGPSLLDVAADRGIEVVPYDPAPTTLAHARQLSRLADQVHADLVHVYGTWSGARATYWGPAFGGRRPWVQTVYEMAVSPVVHSRMPLVVGTADLCDSLRDRPGRTVLISPPVNISLDRPEAVGGCEFRRAHDAAEGVLIVVVSRLDSDMKALPVEVAIAAMANLASEDATLVIVGTGDAEERLRTLGARINADAGRQVVKFAGPSADPRPAYAAADIVLGMGGSAARALAFGKPLIVQGEAGWSATFARATADSLARASYWSLDTVPDPVERLIDNLTPLVKSPTSRAELGQVGREWAVSHFGLQAMTERLVDLYAYAISHYSVRDWLLDLDREGARLAEKIVRVTRRRL